MALASVTTCAFNCSGATFVLVAVAATGSGAAGGTACDTWVCAGAPQGVTVVGTVAAAGAPAPAAAGTAPTPGAAPPPIGTRSLMTLPSLSIPFTTSFIPAGNAPSAGAAVGGIVAAVAPG